MDDYKETVSSGHSRELSNSVGNSNFNSCIWTHISCDSMYKNCAAQVRPNPSKKMGSEWEVLPLTVEFLVIVSWWKRNDQFFSKSVVPGKWAMLQKKARHLAQIALS